MLLIVGFAILVGGCSDNHIDPDSEVYDEFQKALDELDREIESAELYTGTRIGYFEDGSKKYETPYVNGKEHGTVIYYNEDGSKESETPYVNDKRHGTKIEYRSGGSKKEETPYVNGKEHGTRFGTARTDRRVQRHPT